MLKDFLYPTGKLYCGDKARTIIPFVRQKIEDLHKSGDLVIFLCDFHRKDDGEFELFPPTV
jgi:nicotinamidase/pyrazinamidase